MSWLGAAVLFLAFWLWGEPLAKWAFDYPKAWYIPAQRWIGDAMKWLLNEANFGLFTFTDLIVIYVLTRGGPFDSTQVIASYAFFTGIEGGDLAGGAAISLFLFPVLVAVAILFLTVARRAEVA